MSKNGGEPTDILTLEQALIRFKRKRSEVGAITRVTLDSKVLHADFSADDRASASARHSEANAAMSSSEDVVAVIDGIPRTLEQLEQLAAAEHAYTEDFSEDAADSADVEDGADAGEEIDPPPAHRFHMSDYAFIAMGSALMLLVAVMMKRGPVASNRPNLVSQTIATPALMASSQMSADNLITTLVMVPDSNASAGRRVAPDRLEAQIKDTLKSRAFPDIGVSVSKMGDAYLAGEVYSLDEARRISQIVHRVNGVNRVHFLHPDVRPAIGPAYFGATAAWAPDVWGAKVRTVIIGSPADKAGIKPGDVISEFDGKTVPDAKTLNDLIAQYSPGQRVQFRVWHKGQPEYLVARLGESTTMASR